MIQANGACYVDENDDGECDGGAAYCKQYDDKILKSIKFKVRTKENDLSYVVDATVNEVDCMFDPDSNLNPDYLPGCVEGNLEGYHTILGYEGYRYYCDDNNDWHFCDTTSIDYEIGDYSCNGLYWNYIGSFPKSEGYYYETIPIESVGEGVDVGGGILCPSEQFCGESYLGIDFLLLLPDQLYVQTHQYLFFPDEVLQQINQLRKLAPPQTI